MLGCEGSCVAKATTEMERSEIEVGVAQMQRKLCSESNFCRIVKNPPKMSYNNPS